MNHILSIPFAYRLAAMAVVGVFVGNLVNVAIHTLGWRPRRANPWSPLHPYDQRSRWLDRLPLIGWWRLRRKGDQLGERFWVRPLLVELLAGALFAGLYWWEIGQQGLIVYRPEPPAAVTPSPATFEIMHAVCFSHLLLVSLMLAASFIDIDDQVIPDAVTVPGTLLGLMLAAGYSWCLLPGHVALLAVGQQFVEFVTFLYPSYDSLKQWSRDWGGVLTLALGLGCYWAWCLALLPRLWRPSLGLLKAFRYLCAHALRSDAWPTIATIAVAGTCGIALVWWDGGEHWIGLLTALVGMAVGGGLVWAVRIVAGFALGREAMGFGDVTLMAMIGAFLGWQVCPIIFFLSPFIGLPLLLVWWFFRGQREISFGPFLCLATLTTIVFWQPIWDNVEHLYYWGWPIGVPNPAIIPAGWLVPAALVCCLALLAVMLGVYQIMRDTVYTLRSRNKPS
ncbi:MAG TPA: A24 family peptidase [Pirellulales bacterium]|nr:A24 family peptidase [Pirellulales bacterium]